MSQFDAYVYFIENHATQQITDDTRHDIVCDLCNSLLVQCYESNCCCGVLLCFGCYSGNLKTTHICCQCSKTRPEYNRTYRREKEIANIIFSCPNSDQCTFKAKVSEMKVHLSTQICEVCNTDIPCHEKENHLEICMKAVIKCPYSKWSGCDHKCERSEMKEHQALLPLHIELASEKEEKSRILIQHDKETIAKLRDDIRTANLENNLLKNNNIMSNTTITRLVNEKVELEKTIKILKKTPVDTSADILTKNYNDFFKHFPKENN
jgi:hypothetical protein